MAKVILQFHYEINPDKRSEYLATIKELKTLMKGDGLESYHIFESQKKPNTFQELFVFKNIESYEAFDDGDNERTSILVQKLEGLKILKTTKTSSFAEVVFA